MRRILIMILILSQQLILSQEVIIQNEKTILSKQKTIDVAKIIENEKSLQKRVDELENHLLKLNDSIQSSHKKYSAALNTIERLSKVVKNQYEDINELTERDIVIEKKKNNYGFYSFVNVGSTKERFTSLDVGVSFIRSKVFYSLSVDPITIGEPIFKVGIGLKLF